MADPQEVLAQRVRDAIVASFGPAFDAPDPPAEIARELVSRLDVADVCTEPVISGPGFINLTLREDWIAAQALLMLDGDRLGLAPATPPQTVVVEYSSPNIDQEMHVGHLRTTSVGDGIAR